MLKIKGFGATDVGLVRKNNEDAFELTAQNRFLALADGMGGHNAGEVASKEAITFICASIEEMFISTSKPIELSELSSKLKHYMESTNNWVYRLSKKKRSFQGMGTTLSTILFQDDRLIIAHVGDSRIYRLRNGQFTQLTKDHSAGKHTLTQAIGTSLKVNPQIEVNDLKNNDIYLLCSDGLPDVLTNDQIAKAIEPNHLKASAYKLIDLAKQAGGFDNITVVLSQVVKK
ncbi:MAG: PP2C-family Ser/Thr phosphatase [Chlamydiia bacterium]|nr:PP2C-family Ser/Thr phosphatase [Chlamydiia bacterium]MCH9615408.1 PP2C-family Ser/Thr phosphatase [Chlamydiia bacterium]MCH9628270.1 PP2C-family Ser/Thr phosphatase [Chlamydiia bacterium]